MDYARVNFFLSSFLLELSLLEKLGERERNFFLIVYSPDGHNSQNSAILKLRASFQVSHRVQGLGSYSAAFPGTFQGAGLQVGQPGCDLLFL